MSNAAAMVGQEYAYFVWGITNDSHEVVGTDFDFHKDVKNEPLEHYLARQIKPDLTFEFKETTFRKGCVYRICTKPVLPYRIE